MRPPVRVPVTSVHAAGASEQIRNEPFPGSGSRILSVSGDRVGADHAEVHSTRLQATNHQKLERILPRSPSTPA
jgi:hypothetical protein